ncbi:hypothetical protein [Marinobacter mobilis]|uniref:hypothetical protein n=1 Tax=Marinobacter mobilis TaxID=488533 RepID=UPI0035C72614
MKKQAIVRFLVLLLTSLMSSAVMAQGVIKYDFQGTYSFHLTGEQWGTISGLHFDVRQSFGSLLNEPVTNNNVRYWFDREPFEPSINLFRDVPVTPSAEGPVSKPDGDHWAIISFEDGDSISVSRTTGGLFQVSYPYDRFVDQARVVSAHFVGRYQLFNRNESIEMLGGFNGVYGVPGNWGWNFPGSPSWNRALVSSYNFIDRGTEPVAWYSTSQARDIFANVIEACQPVCEGNAIGLQDLNLNIHGVLNDIASQSEEFRMAYYKGDTRTAMLNSLLAAAQSEPDPQLRRRRHALANRAMEAFGNEQSHTFRQQQGFAADQRKQSTTEQAMAVTNDALCQMMTEGEVKEATLSQLKQLVQQQEALPRQLQDRAEESLELLSKEGLGDSYGQVTLTWGDASAEELLLRVYTPGNGTHWASYIPNEGSRTTLRRIGKYKVEVSAVRGSATNYQLSIRRNGEYDVYDGYISYREMPESYEFTVDSNQSAEREHCRNFTEL